MSIYKKSAVTIAAILATVATLAFLVVNVTPLFIAAYGFTLLAIGVLLWVNLFLIDNARTYPWGAALPQMAASYLGVEFSVSLAAILLEQLAKIVIPAKWFVVIQALILSIFAIRLILLNAGRVEIERVEHQVEANTHDWKFLVADIEALATKSADVKPLLDAVKYSDPVTSNALTEYDAKIRDGVSALAIAVEIGDAAKVAETLPPILRQIQDRNRRAKLSKN
jgi:hypothetical protein